jgi:hypothetical protein
MKHLIILLVAALIPLNLYGQQKQRQTEEIKSQAQVVDEDMASQTRSKGFPEDNIQFGGWINPMFFDQWNKSQKLIADSIDARLWMKAYLVKDIFIYGRVKDVYTGIIKNKGFGKIDKNDNQFELDMAYAGFSNESRSLNISAGRKFYSVGTGLVLNGRGDGAEVDYYSSTVNVTLLGMYTGLLIKENNPYNLSTKDAADGAMRAFTGGMFYRTISNQTVYAFGLAQFDLQDYETGDKSKYDSQYWGAGSRGFIGEGLSYYGEIVYETGQAYDSSGSKDSISAYAINTELDYYLGMKMNPTLIFQYAMGSGDRNRRGKSSNGNQSGDDHGFMYFGTYTGGYALRPYLMNIHVVRGGFSIAPMSDSDKLYLSRMFLIFKYSLYFKDEKNAPIADGGASEEKMFVGHGLDLAYKWIIYSDLSVFLNGAVFIPGSAYSSGSRNNQYFVFSGFNLAF